MGEGAAGAGGDGGHAFFAETLWRGICISQWSAGRHADRAKAILGAAGLAPTAIAVGLVGVGEVPGVGLDSLAGPDSPFHGILAPLLAVGLFGIASVLA